MGHVIENIFKMSLNIFPDIEAPKKKKTYINLFFQIHLVSVGTHIHTHSVMLPRRSFLQNWIKIISLLYTHISNLRNLHLGYN